MAYRKVIMDVLPTTVFILTTVFGLSAGEVSRQVFNCDGTPDECTNYLLDSFKKHCESNPGKCSGITFKVKDKNECEFERGSKDGHNCNSKFSECVNTEGSFYCICKNGYSDPNEGNITSSGQNCTDIDECAGNPCAPDHSICTNTNGSFTCACVEGFAGDSAVLCSDVDECDSSPCPGEAICTNILGSFTCKCASGYEYNSATNTCDNINECNATPGPCVPPATCSDRDGTYECTCPDGEICANDPCSGTTDCSTFAICVAVADGYTCVCPEGYSGNPRGSVCSDIDECDLNFADCHARAECQNTDGSYNCVCKTGFQGDGQSCEDIDECEGSSPPSCGSNSICKNTYGSAECECVSGFQFASDNVTCEDINECVTVDCGTKGSCVNTEGSYECSCDAGYTGNPCSDIDECDIDPSLCPENAQCRDTEGSYNCVCDIGYEEDGTTCTDINECANGFTCKAGATCVNLPGTVECQCLDGYSGTPCTNIDECATNPCPGNQTCTDTVGSYTCTCPDGYYIDGTLCVFDFDECANGFNCENGGTCVNQPGTVECQCLDGYSGTPCSNVNECAANPCPGNQTCTDTVGSYTCGCPDGYYVDGTLCSMVRSTSCRDVTRSNAKVTTATGGVFDIYVESIGTVEVFCDLETDGGGWTVFQRRMDGSVDFYRPWNDYVNGFGTREREFWLGLENIYQMIKDGDYELRVDLGAFSGETAYAHYRTFSIDSSADNYKLHYLASSFSGDAGDSLSGHNEMEFSTFDADNDPWGANCAQYRTGAWWYYTCVTSDLNGPYHSSVGTGGNGIIWYYWKGNQFLKFSEMKFRKKDD